MQSLLLFSAFVVSTCGLVYELISGTLASYLLGDSVTQFSTIIGVYLFSMGIGSFLSKYVRKNLIATFVQVELMIGLVGGFSAALLFVLFEHVSSFRIILYALVSVTGGLIGLEIPLLMRILKGRIEFNDLVSKVFTFDYVGALLASLLFPLVLVPHLGLVRSSFLFGIFNVLVALWTLRVLRGEAGWVRGRIMLGGAGFFILLFLLAGFIFSDRIMNFAEASTYPDPIIYAKSSLYQRLVITRSPRDLRLFLNGNLQFSSRDEYRYHEALVHPGLQWVNEPKRVLVLGGGDGLAVREILKYPAIESVTLVDLDPAMIRLFSSQKILTQLNEEAFSSPKVKVIHSDAFIWLKVNQEKFDFIVVDFPDPSNFSIGKLYSTTFYRLLSRALNEKGAAVIQSTSPYVARKSYWCVDATVRSVGLLSWPYHAYVPSFGEWGFILVTRAPYSVPEKFLPGLRFVNGATAQEMFSFPPDMGPVPTEINRLNNQALVHYFEEEWSEYAH